MNYTGIGSSPEGEVVLLGGTDSAYFVSDRGISEDALQERAKKLRITKALEIIEEDDENANWLRKDGRDIQKARVAYHEHDGFPEHSVAVKHHQEYFSQQPTRVLSPSLTRFLETPRLVNVVRVLGEEEGRPYLVGGSVRDALLGIPVKDFDIEVHGISSEKLGAVLQERLGAKGEQVGKQFGVWKLGDIDISVPRKETKTGPKHTDFVVTQTPNATPEEAARRRDFTVNALMYDPVHDKLLDFFGGVKDLKAGILRHVDDKTFVEDPLRVYRAAQFAARFNFDVAESTKRLAAQMDLSSLPTERIYDEFRKMLLRANKPSVGIRALDDMDVLRRYYLELYALKTVPQSPDYHAEGNVFNHTLLALDKAAEISLRFKSPNNRLSIMLATLLHDLGKQNTTEVREDGSVTQYKHELTGVPFSKEFLSKLTTESEVVDDVLFLVENHLTPARFYASQAPAAAFRRLINKWGLRRLGLLAAVSEADITGRRQKTETGELIEPTGIAIDWFRKQVAKVVSQSGVTTSNYLKPLITGDALIARGFEEGKLVGDILRDVRERQETGELTSSQDALTYVDATYKAGTVPIVAEGIQDYGDVLTKQAEFGRPPRPGLVPQTGDPYHPGRWVRPEEAEAAAGKIGKVPPHPKKDAFPFRLTEEEIDRMFVDLPGYRSQEVREDYRNVKNILGDNLIVEEQPNLPANHQVLTVHLAHLTKIPTKFLVAMKTAGVTVSLSGHSVTAMDKLQYLKGVALEGHPSNYTYDNSVAGLYDPNTKRIFVGGSIGGPSVAIHEVAHAMDYNYGFSGTDVFGDAHVRLRHKLSPYEVQIEEFVAESIAIFLAYGKADVAWTYDAQFADDLERILSEA